MTAIAIRRASRLAAALTFAASSADAQDAPDIVTLGNDPRAVSMGYALTTLVDDATALWWNPAGLASVDRRQFRVSARSQLGFTLPSEREAEVGGYYGTTRFGQLLPIIDELSVSQPLQLGGRQYVASAAWHSMVTGTRAQEYLHQTTVTADLVARDYESTVTTGGLRAVSLGLGTRLADMLDVGASAHVMHGSQRSRFVRHFRYNGAEIRTIEDRDLVNQRGVAFDVGLRTDIDEQLTVAARLSLPHTRRGTYQRNGAPDIAYEQRIPATRALGLTYKKIDGSMLAFDVRFEPLSNATFRDADADTAITSTAGTQDITSFHVGYERAAKAAPASRTWRMGAYYRPTSHSARDNRQIAGLGFSVGHAWNLGSRRFEVGSELRFGLKYERLMRDGWLHNQRNNELRFVGAYGFAR